MLPTPLYSIKRPRNKLFFKYFYFNKSLGLSEENVIEMIVDNNSNSYHVKIEDDSSNNTLFTKNNLKKKIPAFERDSFSFMNDLQNFHEIRGSPFTRVPKISGKDVDLHQLYTIVTKKGGWLKVNAKSQWEEIVSELKLPIKCVNSEIALKQIYIRYLDKYERFNFHGEDIDRNEEEDDEKRHHHHRRWSVRTLHAVPVAYNYAQHNIQESTRASLKLSTDLHKPTEYDKLMLSLLSPLPNEQDFAINVCTLMANESKHTLKVDNCPRLLYVLLSHAGVFHHFSMRDMFNEFYTEIRKNSLQKFWKDCLSEKPQVLQLAFEDYFSKMDTDPSALIAAIYNDEDKMDDDEDDDDIIMKPGSLKNLNFLSLGRGLGTNDYIGQRVLQIASILRNLSFNDENILVLAKNRTFVRFLIMCANARWGNLHHMGLDMLGNIATDLEIQDPTSDEVTRCLLSSISEGLEGADRGVIISCLEILSKIAQKESNEDNLHRCLNQNVYEQICLFLTLNDIMLLLYTLECIYSLTSIGEKPCHSLMQVRGIVDTLVSLVTVEAQSYGPDACILMRVVETIPGNSAVQSSNMTNLNVNPPTSTVVQPSSTPTMAQLTVHNDPPTSIPAPLTVVSELPKSSASPTPSFQNMQTNTTFVNRPQSSQSPQIPVNIINKEHPLNSTTGPAIATVSSAAPPLQQTTSVIQTVAAKHAQQQAIQENEHFALAWLKATFEPAQNLQSRLEQQEVYKMYINASSKIGRKGVLSPPHFPRCVRSVFGGTVGPNQLKVESNGIESMQNFYEGIRMRAKPLTIIQKSAVSSAMSQPTVVSSSSSTTTKKSIIVTQYSGKKNQNQQSPLLQQVLTSPNNSGEIKQQQQTIQTSSIVTATTTSAGTPSSLIKSLLANKVTTVESNTAAPSSLSTTSCLIAPNVNVHQVAQRQHMQKQKQLAEQSAQHIQNASVVVTSNNSNNMTNIKVGNSTISIKPGTLPNNTVITATNPLEKSTDCLPKLNNPPPLAPLSQTTIIKPVSAINISDVEDKIPATIEFMSAGNSKITSNKMLADLLDKKSLEPPVFQINDTTIKRKSEDGLDSMPPMKKLEPDSALDDTPKPSTKAADLYAELAGSILEDEDLEEVEMKPKEIEPPKPKPPQAPQQQLITMPMQRQIIVSPNNTPQVILSSGGSASVAQQMSQTTATIKTETGYQTVPVILQHSSQQNQMSNFQLPKQTQVMQPTMMTQQAPTQYILATNQQGQTYVVAQPQAQMQQTVLLAQTPQQHGTGQKTIIILQQQPGGGQQIQQIQQASSGTIIGGMGSQNAQQKVIMTTHQGQQVIMTQVPRQMPQQIIVSHPITNVTSNPVITSNTQSMHAPTSSSQVLEKKQIYITSNNSGGSTISIDGAIISSSSQITAVNANPQFVQAQIAPAQSQQQQQIQQHIIQKPQQQIQMIQQQSQQTTSQQIQQIIQQGGQQTIQLVQQPQTMSYAQAQSQITITQHQTQTTPSHTQPQLQPQVQPKLIQPPPLPVISTTANTIITTSNNPISTAFATATPATSTLAVSATPNSPQQLIQMIPAMDPSKIIEEDVDLSWLYVCDWRGCPKKKFKSANEVYTHACAVHCPENVDSAADIYCQWGSGPGLCDNLPRKRFSLMTHIFDRHCTPESFKTSVQRRISNVGNQTPQQPYPVTLIRQPAATPPASSASSTSSETSNTTPVPITSNGPGLLSSAGPAALHAIKRHAIDFVNPKELLDDNEGPVTKSIRLTAALILRNLVNYNSTAKRNIRYYEPHLAGVALSNVESSRTIAQVLFEMNDTSPF